MGEPKLHCPRCGSPAWIMVDMIETDTKAPCDRLGVDVFEFEMIGQASCTNPACREPPLDLPASAYRWPDSGWIPPAAFDERSKAWYREAV